MQEQDWDDEELWIVTSSASDRILQPNFHAPTLACGYRFNKTQDRQQEHCLESRFGFF
ncbi:hypothetical protein [Tumidithrix elongata]|uniref:hypothetical protein n=1 Tax=Tumidithrix elongata TaxID=3088357 RepID=UPI002ED05A98